MDKLGKNLDNFYWLKLGLWGFSKKTLRFSSVFFTTTYAAIASFEYNCEKR